jgi:Response regulator containing CheY-like receiver, AAA-type ATPase, and DNA-binding domains
MSQQETRKRRVIIAEDDDAMRKVVRELIEGLGVDVEEASSGADLIELLVDEKPIDLFITDIRMPWMTGLQIALSVRNAGLNMPILVITAFGDDHLRAQVEKLGNATLLDKPFKADQLLSLASSFLLSYDTTKN